MTFEQWKRKCVIEARELGLPLDLWADDDPYELFDVAEEAYESEQSPGDFIRETFAEDLASSENDAAMVAEYEESMEDDEEEGDYEGEDDDYEGSLEDV